MPIDNFSLTTDGGWTAVDLDAAVAGRLWQSSRIDPAFKLGAIKCAPGATVPRRQHNLDALLIVVDGDVTVEWMDGAERSNRVLGAGGFWVASAHTPYAVTAGSDGAILTVTFAGAVEDLETTSYAEDQPAS